MAEEKWTQVNLLVNKADKVDLMALEDRVDNLNVGGDSAGSEELTNLITQLGTVESTVNTAKSDIDVIKPKITALETATQDIGMLTTTANTAKSDIAELKPKVTALENATKDLGTLTTTANTAKTDIASLKSRVSSLEGDVSGLSTFATDNTVQIANLISRIEALEAAE